MLEYLLNIIGSEWIMIIFIALILLLGTNRFPEAAAAEDHQTKNAQALVNAGAARILFEKNLKPQEFYHTIMNLIHSKEELNQMVIASKKLGKPNATKDIVNHIMELAV